MARRKARDSRITEIRGTSGELVSYNALFQYKDPATGKWRQRPKRHKSLEAAETWLREQDARAGLGRAAAPSREPLGRAIAHWIALKASTGLKESTVISYRTILATVYGSLWARPISELRADEFEACYLALKERTGRLRGTRKVGGTAGAYAHLVLKSCLRYYVEQHQLVVNPLEGVMAPRNDTKAKRPWSWDEVHRFLAHEQARPMYPLWLLLFEKKLRLGEAQALRWCDLVIDGADGTGALVISATVTRCIDPASGRYYDAVGDRAKTPDGMRRLTIDGRLQQVLRAHRDRARFEAQALGFGWDEEQFLFLGPRTGAVLGQSTIRDRLKKACIAAGVRPLAPHGLRVTGISRAAGDGQPLFYLMEEAGHSDPKTTKRYVKLSEAEHRAWTKRFAELTHREPPPADEQAEQLP